MVSSIPTLVSSQYILVWEASKQSFPVSLASNLERDWKTGGTWFASGSISGGTEGSNHRIMGSAPQGTASQWVAAMRQHWVHSNSNSQSWGTSPPSSSRASANQAPTRGSSCSMITDLELRLLFLHLFNALYAIPCIKLLYIWNIFLFSCYKKGILYLSANLSNSSVKTILFLPVKFNYINLKKKIPVYQTVCKWSWQC